MRPLAIILLLALGACATRERVVYQRVEVPVAVSCVPDNLKGPPDYPDTDEALEAAPEGPVRYALMAAGRLLRIQRAAEVEPVLKACR
jgi:hypothetical protein